MSEFFRADTATSSGPPPFVDSVVESLHDALYDVNDESTGIGGRVDPDAARAAFEHTTDGHGGRNEARRLHISLDEITFSPTRVGQRSIRSITVTNTDPTRTIELDRIDLDDQGLGDFEVHGASVPLAPQETATFHVSYAPTAQGTHIARVRMFESAGMSTPFIALRGTATDDAGSRRERVGKLEAELGDSKKRPSTHLQERVHAREAISEWRDRTKDVIHATATWTTQNWTRFLSETGGDFRVSWSEGHLANVIGDYLSTVAGFISSNPIIEFVASAITSLIYDAIFTDRGNRENEEAVFRGVRKTGNEIEKKQIDVAWVEADAVSMVDAHAITAKHRAHTTSSLEEITHVTEWAVREKAAIPAKINTSDRSLYRQLIQTWVLERSATAREPTESTNRPAFEAARRSAFGLTPEQDIARPDLFIFQAMFEWSALGISNLAQIETSWRRRVATLIAEARGASLEDADVASYVKNMMAQPLHVDLVPTSIEGTRLAMEGAGIPLPQRDYLKNRLECAVTLEIDGSSVIIKFFNYYLGRHVGLRTP